MKFAALIGLMLPTLVLAQPIERELHYLVTVDATQDWYKNDPKYPGDQHSKGWTKQKYELKVRLRSDGELHVRNLLDPNLEARMEAKVVRLARQALKKKDADGNPMKIPKTEEERAAFSRKMSHALRACNAEPTCYSDTMLTFAAIIAAADYPEALEEENIPGRYLYFEPFEGCAESSRITLRTEIEGVRYNKTSDKFVPFSETHEADTVNASDGIRLCSHFLAVIDTQEKERPMYQETIFVPRPVGLSTYTESAHTSRTEEPQPMPMAATDWMTEHLRRAEPSGETTVDLPLVLPLNGNATWLGKWKGNAKVTMRWSFDEVPAPKSADGSAQ